MRKHRFLQKQPSIVARLPGLRLQMHKISSLQISLNFQLQDLHLLMSRTMLQRGLYLQLQFLRMRA